MTRRSSPGSGAGITPLSPPPSLRAGRRRAEGGGAGLSSKVKCQTQSIPRLQRRTRLECRGAREAPAPRKEKHQRHDCFALKRHRDDQITLVFLSYPTVYFLIPLILPSYMTLKHAADTKTHVYVLLITTKQELDGEQDTLFSIYLNQGG